MQTDTRMLRISCRADGKFVTLTENPQDSPLGVDASLNHAIGTAVREATIISRSSRCRVAICVEKPNGHYRTEQLINPPRAIRRNPRPAQPPR